MFLIILGAIVIAVGYSFAKSNSPVQKFSKLIRLVGFGFLVIGLAFSCVVQIDAGQVGVQKLFGKVQNRVLQSGLNFINPLVDVVKMDIKTQNYTMSGIQDEGHKSGDDAIRVLTADGLEVTIDLSVLYRVVPADAPRLIAETGDDYEDKIVRPLTRTRIRDNAVYYEAVALYSTKRDEFQQRIFKNIEEDFKKRGLLLENLLVRNITLPASVRATIEQKINAEQEAQKMQFILQKKNRKLNVSVWKHRVLPITSASSVKA
ncbi:MAG: prohibitin family protein [Lacibacter sp.]